MDKEFDEVEVSVVRLDTSCVIATSDETESKGTGDEGWSPIVK